MRQHHRPKSHRLQSDKNTTARFFSDAFGAALRLGFTAALVAAFSATLAQAQPFAYITNAGSDTVSVIDTSTNTVTATVPVGNTPSGVAVTPDGAFVYVTNQFGDNVSVIDTSTNTVTAIVPVGDRPFGVAVTPNGALVYVANQGNVDSDTVSVIDTSTNMVVDTVTVGSGPAAFGMFIGPARIQPPLPKVKTFEATGFCPGLGTLVGMGFDPVSGNVFVYPDFDTVIHEFTPTGAEVLPTIPRAGNSSNDFDLDFLPAAATIGGVSVPANTLLVINGDDSPDKLHAINKDTGTLLATVNIAASGLHVGGSYHQGRQSLFIVNTADTISEINPATGAVLNSFPVAPTGSPAFGVNFGDVEMNQTSGNLFVVSDNQNRIRELTPTGEFVQDIDLGDLVSGMSGIAIDDTTRNIFLSSTNGSVYLLGFVPAPVAMADLSVAKADSPDPVTEGEDVTYTITVTNNGPDAATSVLLTDTLPAGVTFVSASSGCTEVNGVVACDIGALANDANAMVEIVVTTTGAGTITNTAVVAGNQGDPDEGNNTDTENTTVNAVTPPPVHDLAVTKITAPQTVTLTASKPSLTKPVKVQIQNRSPHDETIPDLATLDNLVTLSVTSLGSCPSPSQDLQDPGLPKTLKPKKTLTVVFDVTFACANDPAKGAGHEDYRYTATVDHAALDREADTHPADDSCPRAPQGLTPIRMGRSRTRGVRRRGRTQCANSRGRPAGPERRWRRLPGESTHDKVLGLFVNNHVDTIAEEELRVPSTKPLPDGHAE
jgi:uncharacterized repeat protein (TIGR01451 family)